MGKQLQMFGADWTEDKLNRLREYLHQYNIALKKQRFTRVYVDAFAGTGYREARRRQYRMPALFDDDSQALFKGSAKMSLEVQPPFDRYMFIEKSPAKVEELHKLMEEHLEKSDRVSIVLGDANDELRRYCASEDWRKTRAVVFLDPFATQVGWATVEAIARTKAIDLWYLFPLMAVTRLLANDPNKTHYKCLDRMFGTRDWFDRFYRPRSLKSVFFDDGLPEVEKGCDSDAIGAYFKERLDEIFAGVAKKPRILRNGKGTPLFQLFFAAANERGAEVALRIAEYLLEKW